MRKILIGTLVLAVLAVPVLSKTTFSPMSGNPWGVVMPLN
jgi:hypothetical protein